MTVNSSYLPRHRKRSTQRGTQSSAMQSRIFLLSAKMEQHSLLPAVSPSKFQHLVRTSGFDTNVVIIAAGDPYSDTQYIMLCKRTPVLLSYCLCKTTPEHKIWRKAVKKQRTRSTTIKERECLSSYSLDHQTQLYYLFTSPQNHSQHTTDPIASTQSNQSKCNKLSCMDISLLLLTSFDMTLLTLKFNEANHKSKPPLRPPPTCAPMA